MAADRLVHRVVDDFGEEVMQGIGVRAADEHTRTAAHRLESVENFDIGGRIGPFAAGAAGRLADLFGDRLQVGAWRRAGSSGSGSCANRSLFCGIEKRNLGSNQGFSKL